MQSLERYVDSVRLVRVTTLVDSQARLDCLLSSWGLSLLVEVGDGGRYAILVDTPGSFSVLERNASLLGLDLSRIDAIFISHWHGDHCGALTALLQELEHDIPVYIPSWRISAIEEIKRAGGSPAVCEDPVSVCKGVMTTGSMGQLLREHSLLVNVADRGLIVLSGCSHPGVVEIVRRSRQVSHVPDVHILVGGLHIGDFREGRRVASSLKSLGVNKISPCHCTGSPAKSAIRDSFGRDFTENGSGTTISVGQGRF